MHDCGGLAHPGPAEADEQLCRTLLEQGTAECLVSGQAQVQRIALDSTQGLLWAATTDSTVKAWRLPAHKVPVQADRCMCSLHNAASPCHSSIQGQAQIQRIARDSTRGLLWTATTESAVKAWRLLCIRWSSEESSPWAQNLPCQLLQWSQRVRLLTIANMLSVWELWLSLMLQWTRDLLTVWPSASCGPLPGQDLAMTVCKPMPTAAPVPAPAPAPSSSAQLSRCA